MYIVSHLSADADVGFVVDVMEALHFVDVDDYGHCWILSTHAVFA